MTFEFVKSNLVELQQDQIRLKPVKKTTFLIPKEALNGKITISLMFLNRHHRLKDTWEQKELFYTSSKFFWIKFDQI